MATFKDIADFFNRLESTFLRRAVPRLIAETATEFFKQKFTSKEWEGQPWPAAKNPPARGSLMLRSGALVNSIKPSTVNEERVVISAGSSKVPYAEAHNEGGDIKVRITPKMRKYAWARHYNTKDSSGNSPWKGLALTKKTELKITMPRRRFMGPSKTLNGQIMERMRSAFKGLF